MKKDKIYETHPELDYDRRWTEAIEHGKYKEALTILDEGIKFAKERKNVLFVKNFQNLKKITKTRYMKGQEAIITCSFCGKKKTSSLKMVGGAKAFICENCIKLACEILRKKSTLRKRTRRPDKEVK